MDSAAGANFCPFHGNKKAEVNATDHSDVSE